MKRSRSCSELAAPSGFFQRIEAITLPTGPKQPRLAKYRSRSQGPAASTCLHRRAELGLPKASEDVHPPSASSAILWEDSGRLQATSSLKSEGQNKIAHHDVYARFNRCLCRTELTGTTDLPAELTPGVRPRSETAVPCTPASSSRGSTSSTASSAEQPAQRLPRCDIPRQFLTSEKRTTPKGFRQPQRNPDISTRDTRAAYTLGDGFSEYEAVPTGLIQVGGKRKFSHHGIALGQLELTQTSKTEPEEKKRKRYTRIRKRDRREDNPFDFADAQLAPRVAKRGSSRDSKEHGMDSTASETWGGLSTGMSNDVGRRPHGSSQRGPVTKPWEGSPGGVKPEILPSNYAAMERAIPKTVLSLDGEMIGSEMQLAGGWGTYEISQTPAVEETQLAAIS